MSQPDSEYTDRQRIIHKLTGAAYIATFEEEYELAVDLCRLIAQYESERYAAVETDATGPAIADGGDPDAG